MNNNYSLRLYECDYKIACSVFYKKFRNAEFLKEDLIDVGLIAILNSRHNFLKEKSKFSTFAFNVAFCAMKKYLDSNKYIQSLSDKITNDLTIEDTLGEEMHINELGLEKLFKQIKKNVKRKLGDKSSSYLTFIDCKLNLMLNSEIKQQLNCSRQFVSKLNMQLKNDIIKFSRNTDLAKEIDYYANNNN